jgi:hypothetical protein
VLLPLLVRLCPPHLWPAGCFHNNVLCCSKLERASAVLCGCLCGAVSFRCWRGHSHHYTTQHVQSPHTHIPLCCLPLPSAAGGSIPTLSRATGTRFGWKQPTSSRPASLPRATEVRLFPFVEEQVQSGSGRGLMLGRQVYACMHACCCACRGAKVMFFVLNPSPSITSMWTATCLRVQARCMPSTKQARS